MNALLWVTLFSLTLLVIIILAWPVFRRKKLTNARKIGVLVWGLCFSFTALTLYWFFGDSQGLQLSKQPVEHASPQQLIQRIKHRLNKQPDDPTAWYWLGRLYIRQNAYTQAVHAFEKARQLRPEDPDINLQLAQALYYQEGAITPRAKQLLEQVLAMEPNNRFSLNLLAMGAYLQENYVEAIDYWEQLQKQLTRDDPDYPVIQRALTQARTKSQATY